MDIAISLARSVLGIAVLLGLCYGFSENRSKVRWKLILSGLGLQVVLAFLILEVSFVRACVNGVSRFFSKLMEFSDEGAMTVFGQMPLDVPAFGMAFTVLPAIIFFSAFSAVLYHLGVLQRIVFGFAWLMSKTMRLTGAECLAAAANIFVGQTEAPLIVKPYLKGMTRSEVMSLMTGGMATIAGGVLVIYMKMLGGADREAVVLFGQHLLTASILSAPAAMIVSKLLVPQLREVDCRLSMPKERLSESLLDAATRGTSDGVKLALNVGGMLIAFTALVALANYCMSNWVGSWTGLNDWVFAITDGKFEAFDFSFVVGVLSAPFAWLIGVESGDILIVGQLLGERLVLNEFLAFIKLAEFRNSGLLESDRSVVILTYALCGFANLTSVGIQVGGISSLEGSQRENLLRYGMKSLFGGMVACYLTAIIASAFISI